VRAIVDDPDVAIGVIGVDLDPVRPHEQLVVLLPGFDELSVAVENVQDVIPARVPCGILLG
jgi:hypothetical protein